MKKIFIVTGEPSGDKLATTVISKLIKINPDIQFLCVGGTHLSSLGIRSIFDLKEITYLGFTNVLFNIFKIRNRINKTVEEIIKFSPDILFTVDSPDFTLRVAERVKKINNDIKINKIVFVDLDAFIPSLKGIGWINPLISDISLIMIIVFERKNKNSSFKKR